MSEPKFWILPLVPTVDVDMTCVICHGVLVTHEVRASRKDIGATTWFGVHEQCAKTAGALVEDAP